MNRLFTLVAIVVAVVLIYFGIRSKMGSEGTLPDKGTTLSGPVRQDEGLEPVRDALRKGNDAASFRAPQLNKGPRNSWVAWSTPVS